MLLRPNHFIVPRVSSNGGGGAPSAVRLSGLVFDLSSSANALGVNFRNNEAAFDSANPTTGRVDWVIPGTLDHRDGETVIISGVVNSGSDRDWNGTQTVFDALTSNSIIDGAPFNTATDLTNAKAVNPNAIDKIYNPYSVAFTSDPTNNNFAPIGYDPVNGCFGLMSYNNGNSFRIAEGDIDRGLEWIVGNDWAELTMVGVIDDPGSQNGEQVIMDFEINPGGINLALHAFKNVAGYRAEFHYDDNSQVETEFTDNPATESAMVVVGGLRFNGTNYTPFVYLYNPTDGLLGTKAAHLGNRGLLNHKGRDIGDIAVLGSAVNIYHNQAKVKRTLLYDRALTEEEITALCETLYADPFAEEVTASDFNSSTFNPRTDLDWLAYWSASDDDLWADREVAKEISTWTSLADAGSPTGFSATVNLAFGANPDNQYRVGQMATITGDPGIRGDREILDTDFGEVTVATDGAGSGSGGTIKPTDLQLLKIYPVGTLWAEAIESDFNLNGAWRRASNGALNLYTPNDLSANPSARNFWADNGVLPATNRLYMGCIFKMLEDQTDDTEQGLMGLVRGAGDRRALFAFGATDLGGVTSASRICANIALDSATWGAYQYNTDLLAGEVHCIEIQADLGTVQCKFDGADMVVTQAAAGSIADWGVGTSVDGGIGGRPSSSGSVWTDLHDRAEILGFYISTEDVMGNADIHQAWANEFGVNFA